MRLVKAFAMVFVAAFWVTAFPAATPFAGGQQTSPSKPPPAPSSSHARVLFSRSLDDAAQNPPSQAAPAPPTAKKAAAEPPQGESADNAERPPIAFLSYDLDVHLQPKQQAIAVRARMMLRNDGDQPLRQLPLQVSSGLHWTSVQIENRPAVFAERTVASDADHTGLLHEAVIALPRPWPAGQNIAVDVTYEGIVAASTVRLEQIGVPADVAKRTDWDRVSDDFIGVRGFGNVVWYPVVSAPVKLGDGNKFFTEVADQKLRQSDVMVSMQVTEEFFGQAPNLAILNGTRSPISLASPPTSSTLPGIVTCSLPKTRLGFTAPSLFMLSRVKSEGEGLQVFSRPENAGNAQAYLTAATMAAPLMEQWFGARPRSKLLIVDLPEKDDTPFEASAVLFTGIQSTQPEKLAGGLVHSLTHAYFASPYPWLQEGAASFMVTLWVERNSGREAALTQMDNERGALSLAEPDVAAPQPASTRGAGATGDLGTDRGESLIAARDAVYYRTKATYVFWMLRGLVGDDALARAFREYDPAKDGSGDEFEQVLEQASGTDLKWFFTDWVYHDRGLPDLSIAGVYPNSANVAGSYIVAVEVRNSGGAAVEVPVSVRSREATVSARVRVPAKSSATHRFLLVGRPIEATVNDGTAPEVDASVHRLNLDVPP